MTFWTAAMALSLCVLSLSAAAWLLTGALREATNIRRPSSKEELRQQETMERQARRLRHELNNFMTYDGTEQEEGIR